MSRVVRAAQRVLGGAAELAVYQAFDDAIGRGALARQTLRTPGFSLTRATWIKPSFFWMAYRSGWSAKPNQTTTLRVWIETGAFLRILENAALSQFDAGVHDDRLAWERALTATSARVQWDPERNARLAPLERRAIQVVVAVPTLSLYLDAIREIENVTPEMRMFAASHPDTRGSLAVRIVEAETPVALTEAARRAIGADPAPDQEAL